MTVTGKYTGKEYVVEKIEKNMKNKIIRIKYGDFLYLYSINEYQPKVPSITLDIEVPKGVYKMKEEREYRVIKSFTILDLYKKRIWGCSEWEKEFENLLEEETKYRRLIWVSFEDFDQIKCC